MEPSTSKTGINILLVVAIILMGASLFATYTKKPAVNNVQAVATTTPKAPEIVTPAETATTSEASTTTATSTLATSTTPTATTTLSIKGFTDKKWTWVNTTTKGKTTLPKKVEAFTITFNTDNTLKGTTDCNTFFGNYKIETAKISFGMIGSTKMFCEGSQENDFLSNLQGSKKYSIGMNTILTITDGTTTITFK